MEPPDPSFADELNVPQENAVLVFDVGRARAGSPLRVILNSSADGVCQLLHRGLNS